MQVLSINVGHERTIDKGGMIEPTGIYKFPADGPIEVTPLGLVGDCVSDQKHHGGLDQAVYVYGGADYAWWSAKVGHTLIPGTFGDNLTISDLETAPLQLGDRLHIGAVILEVTAPRIPCAKLAVRMDDPQFVKKFRAAVRPGAYCRVIETGTLAAGDTVTLERYSGPSVRIEEVFRAWYEPPTDAATLRQMLAAPMAIRTRQRFERILEELE